MDLPPAPDAKFQGKRPKDGHCREGIAAVSPIAIFTMDAWAATIGSADTRHCGVEREAFEKADAQWQHPSPAEQRRFHSYLVIVHDAENAWRTCAGLPASQASRPIAMPPCEVK